MCFYSVMAYISSTTSTTNEHRCLATASSPQKAFPGWSVDANAAKVRLLTLWNVWWEIDLSVTLLVTWTKLLRTGLCFTAFSSTKSPKVSFFMKLYNLADSCIKLMFWHPIISERIAPKSSMFSNSFHQEWFEVVTHSTHQHLSWSGQPDVIGCCERDDTAHAPNRFDSLSG